MATNKEILEQIDDLRKKMPNGELTLISKSVKDLQTGQQELKEDIRDLKKQLLDPDDGVVVRVNKNSEFRRDRELKLPEFGEAFDHLRDTLHWKDNVNKALWILFTAVVGLVIKTLVMSG